MAKYQKKCPNVSLKERKIGNVPFCLTCYYHLPECLWQENSL